MSPVPVAYAPLEQYFRIGIRQVSGRLHAQPVHGREEVSPSPPVLHRRCQILLAEFVSLLIDGDREVPVDGSGEG